MCGLSTVLYTHIYYVHYTQYTYLLYEFTTIINVGNLNEIRPHIFFYLQINRYNLYLKCLGTK